MIRKGSYTQAHRLWEKALKIFFRIIPGLFYLVALFIALIILIKPGAAIFYWKTDFQNEQITRSENAFEYRLPINLRILDPSTLLVLEDQKVMEFSTVDSIIDGEKGGYAVKEISGDTITILYSPSNGIDFENNTQAYQAYIRPYLVSSNTGGRFFLGLIVGLFLFISSIWGNFQKRTLLLSQPGLEDTRIAKRLLPKTKELASDPSAASIPRTKLVKHAAVNIILIAFLYIFMEWIFFATKPSFMDILGLGEKFRIFFLTGLAAAFISLLTLLIIFLFDLLISPFIPSFHDYAYHVPAAFLASCLCMMLIDNFTYTIFRFGIVNSNSIVRILYALLFIGIFTYILRKSVSTDKKVPNLTNSISAAAIFSLSLFLAVFTIKPEAIASSLGTQILQAANRPNVILLSTDGLNAANMSAYGYERDTTPFITELAKTSLKSENHFTNAAHSMGSDTATLTSKLPFETRVLFPPDTLKGSDKYQHLPGILKRAGYRTVSLGVPFYVDVNTIDFENAFDDVNCQANTVDRVTSRLIEYGFADPTYLFSAVKERVVERLKHIFFIEDMHNPLSAVVKDGSSWITDQQRLNCLYDYLAEGKETGKPVFAHVHLMATHGSKFAPAVQVFSKDQEQDDTWLTDFYDDSILSFDLEVKRLVEYLLEQGLYDNTILVIYTDHAMKYFTLSRLPLIIHFPYDRHAGIVTENSQNLDIPVTILDYMNIQKAPWMQGRSLLEKLDPQHLILAGYGRDFELTSSGNTVISSEAIKPPYYQFGGMTVIQCQYSYTINLIDMTVHVREIEDYQNPCPATMLDSQEELLKKVGEIMTQFGFTWPESW